MKTSYYVLCVLALGALSSFNTNKACEYVGSNIGYVKTQTQKALDATEINAARFHAYKALNAIEKSKNQLNSCGCDYAKKNIYEGLDNLKMATRATTLNSTKLLLERALDNTEGSLEALDEHELHDSRYASDVLAMNTITSEKEKIAMKSPEGDQLHKKIDKTLLNYEKSLNDVINSVECKEAYAFALNIYQHCEKEILKDNLTEAKMYYNLKTKAITKKALQKLEDCRN